VIKATGRANGKPLLILGLSGENMARLMANEPIKIDAADLGLPELTVIVVGGRTEESILANLRSTGAQLQQVDQ
jgi:hypothetical protein